MSSVVAPVPIALAQGVTELVPRMKIVADPTLFAGEFHLFLALNMGGALAVWALVTALYADARIAALATTVVLGGAAITGHQRAAGDAR